MLHAAYEILSSDYQAEPGGSAYIFTKVLKSLGLRPIFIGQVGNDVLGKILIQKINNDRVNVELNINPKAQTNMSANVSGDKNNSISLTADNANQLFKPKELLVQIQKQLPKSKALYIGGYFKMPQLSKTYWQLAKHTKKERCLVILDHGTVHHQVKSTQLKQVLKLLPFVNYYLSNQEEFLRVMKAESLLTAFKKFQKIAKFSTVVVKRGQKGASIFKADKVVTIPTIQVRALHTVGAGDSFNAGFLHGVLKNYSILKSIRFANTYAALRISGKGMVRGR